jgi:5'-3' exonuclease
MPRTPHQSNLYEIKIFSQVYATLTEEERERNVVGQDRLFVGKCHGLFKMIRGIHQERKKNANGNMPAIEEEKWVNIGNGSMAQGIAGQIAYDDDTNAATFEIGTLSPSTLARNTPKGSNEIEVMRLMCDLLTQKYLLDFSSVNWIFLKMSKKT